MNFSHDFARFASTDKVKEDLRTKSVRGAMFMGASGGIEFTLRLGSMLILARLLVPEHFGLIGMVTAVTGIADQLISMGLSTATIQSPEITHQQCSNLFWVNVAAGGILGMIICAIAPVISSFYHDARLAAITLVISTNFLWGGLTVQHAALLNRQMKQPQIACNGLVASFLSACVAIVLALMGKGYWALVWREVTRSFLTAAGIWFLCRWLPGMPNRGSKMGRLLRFGRDMTVTQLLIAIISRLDSLLVGKFAGATALGLYRQAYNLMMAPVLKLNAPIFSVSQPGLSMLQTNPERYRRYYQKILFVVSLTTVPVSVFAAIYAGEIVLVVLGQKWIGAVVFLRIFAVASAIRPTVATSGLVLITCGKSGKYLVVALVHGLTLFVLMAIGIHWGPKGVALAYVGTSVLLMLPKLFFSFSGTPVDMNFFLRAVSRPVIGSLAMGVALVFLRSLAPIDHGVLSLLVGCGTAGIVYLVSLVLLPGGRTQLSFLCNDFREALQRRSSRVERKAIAPNVAIGN